MRIAYFCVNGRSIDDYGPKDQDGSCMSLQKWAILFLIVYAHFGQIIRQFSHVLILYPASLTSSLYPAILSAQKNARISKIKKCILAALLTQST
jgi:hypothetical protein